MNEPVGTISPRELKKRLDAGERLMILDVREDHERDYCRIAAPENVEDLHLPMGLIPSRFEQLEAVDAPIVVYCHHGVRSMMVARWLAARGLTGLMNLDGGIEAWSIQADRGVPRY